MDKTACMCKINSDSSFKLVFFSREREKQARVNLEVCEIHLGGLDG